VIVVWELNGFFFLEGDAVGFTKKLSDNLVKETKTVLRHFN
jgi:hypothetical protein